MTSAAKNYLDDIRARKKDLMRQLEELRDLERAIKSAGKGSEAVKNAARSDNGPTLKDMVLAVLHALNRGAEALEIADEIKATYAKPVMRSSLSPQLSRLKGEGKLILDDKIWYLPKHYEELLAKRERALVSQHIEREAGKFKPLPDWMHMGAGRQREDEM